MNIYLVPLVQYDRGKGKQGTRPAGVETLSAWSTLRINDSLVVVGTPDTLAVIPTGGIQLAADATEKPGAALLRALSNRLGENIDGLRSGKLADLLLDLQTVAADGTKRRPLVASLRDGKKQLELWLGGELIAVQAVPSGGALTDDFNRADSGTLGGAWVQTSGGTVWAISSNKAVNGPFGMAVYDSDIGSTDHYCQVEVDTTVTQYGGPTVRSDTAFSNYAGYPASADAAYYIDLNVSGSFISTLAAVSATIPSTSIAKCTANGSTIQVYENGVLVLSTTDSTLTTQTRGGLTAYPSGTFDNWEAGVLTAPPVADSSAVIPGVWRALVGPSLLNGPRSAMVRGVTFRDLGTRGGGEAHSGTVVMPVATADTIAAKKAISTTLDAPAVAAAEVTAKKATSASLDAPTVAPPRATGKKATSAGLDAPAATTAAASAKKATTAGLNAPAATTTTPAGRKGALAALAVTIGTTVASAAQKAATSVVRWLLGLVGITPGTAAEGPVRDIDYTAGRVTTSWRAATIETAWQASAAQHAWSSSTIEVEWTAGRVATERHADPIDT